MTSLANGDHVKHPRYGHGIVEVDKGSTVLARFEHGYEECEKAELKDTFTPAQMDSLGRIDDPIQVILRFQSETIRTINDAWGAFSPSRIALLPHQLWVCRKVLERWPVRWLIADDVGLGKTIEAGLILWPLINRGVVRRLLVLCPASLVGQWQYRMRTMFDLRMTAYFSDADTSKSDFWNTHDLVVTSLETLRADNNGRHDRFFEAADWDLVIVDEAHHLNSDPKVGQTLGYSLLKRMEEEKKFDSLLFFTGTPHRGKNYNFFALMSLLRPDLFNPRVNHGTQYTRLAEAMIRNNKLCVTDLKGKPLFQAPKTLPQKYTYSAKERHFYQQLTEFIATGKAYASRLRHSESQVVILVLIALQKLASSSVAAVRKALERRLVVVKDQKTAANQYLQNKLLEIKQSQLAMDDDDEQNRRDEINAETGIVLMENEIAWLEKLIELSQGIDEETKTIHILDTVAALPKGTPVLFFTEYKLTQSMMINALEKRFGRNTTCFINGDEKLDGLDDGKGGTRTIRMPRHEAAEQFNEGEKRFLVATEAAGEGIDLQENCCTLIHVDLPWNPMRMHQRVGRLNRYGQKNQVSAFLFLNTETVESLIWEKLNTKINNIMVAMKAIMDDPEDLMQLVIGMVSSKVFEEIHSEASSIPKESFSSWFDQKTSTLGGKDALEMVENLVGNAQKFDFQQASELIPKIDLPDLKDFFLLSMAYNHRQVRHDEDGGISFKCPEAWLGKRGIFSSYENLYFQRIPFGRKETRKMIGAGSPILEAALQQAGDFSVSVAFMGSEPLRETLWFFSVYDRITGGRGQIKKVIAGILDKPGARTLLKDWEILIYLNEASQRIKPSNESQVDPHLAIQQGIGMMESFLKDHLDELRLPFKKPDIELLGVIGIGDHLTF